MQAIPIRIENTTVHASAGSGKTYLLVSRIIQLLLNGAEPGTILAITFTRKAAAEMQQRLLLRLFELAAADELTFKRQLAQLGAATDPLTTQRARNLYEQLLTTDHPVTTTTFHAFCQDLLRRFPLEADVPAGFDLLEHTGNMQDEAWEALMAEATMPSSTALAAALEQLFRQLALNNTRHALMSFIQQRSDWWAYTEQQADPLTFACQRLATQLNIQPDDEPLQAFFNHAQTLSDLRRYLEYLEQRPIATNQKLAKQLHNGLDERLAMAERYGLIRDTFLTQKGTVRACKPSKEMTKVYGEQGAENFINLHAECAAKIQATDERLAALQTWQQTSAWYRAGHHLLQHYQRIKLEQRLLDFTDLEWKSYQLLTHPDNASWVQYKLDNRIKHLLIDEFQDTNPTQWQLVLPLLQEFAAKQTEETNSVFLVGDAKQSIYRFRRAEPRLFGIASDWLHDHMQANSLPLNKSWRSSPAIIEFINHLFGSGRLHDQLPEFIAHETEHKTLWGQVSLLPLITADEPGEEEAAHTELRNPLNTPRQANDQTALTEGQQVAATIAELVAQQTPVGHDRTARPIRYSDILILLRSRTHVGEFEQALRQTGIPYLGAERGTLLEALEVIDMVKLLQWLLSPYDNHALASILRSPLFAATDDDLLLLATTGKGHWQDRLTGLIENLPSDSPLRRANTLLHRWQQLAGHIPVHDLLDRIYFEANVMERYTAAFPASLRSRVVSNLTRFLELALEIDSGRYPSLTRFINWLEALRQQSKEAPDAPPGQGQQDRVRLLTIHEAKGLEAPVVFLVDSARPLQRKTAYEAMVDWGDSLTSPETLLLTGKKDGLDPYSRRQQEHLFALEDREETNLLYVAVSRSQQLLYVSGTAPSRKSDSTWYDAICRQYDITPADMIDSRCLHEAHTPPMIVVTPIKTHKTINIVDPRLGKTIPVIKPIKEIAPSQAVNRTDDMQGLDEDGRRRGLLIHAMLEQLSQPKPASLLRLAQQYGLAEQDAIFQSCLAEAQQVIQAPHLQTLFDPQHYQTAYNEIPISYEHEGRMVYGIIDRLVINEGQILLIDYKTHRQNTAQCQELAEVYKPQLALYMEGIKKIWPEYAIKPQLLFTYSATLLQVVI